MVWFPDGNESLQLALTDNLRQSFKLGVHHCIQYSCALRECKSLPMNSISIMPYPLSMRLFLCALLSSVGLLIILSYSSILPWVPSRHCRAIFCDPYHWQVLSFGIAFLCAGFTFIIPQGWRAIGKINALGVLGGFLVGLIGAFLFSQ
jgi:hypothetical protein